MAPATTTRVALLASSSSTSWQLFVARYAQRLRRQGVQIAVIVLDDQEEKRSGPIRHAWAVASRQARVAGCHTVTAFVRILVYKLFTRGGASENDAELEQGAISSIPIVHVGNLNSMAAVDAVRSRTCDIVCLMGARIISGRTLELLDAPVLNTHASDPALIRGGPPVVWEILGGRRTIAPTIHEVVEKLDAGPIVRQEDVEIQFASSLARTVSLTRNAARLVFTNMLFAALVDYHAGSQERRSYIPGVLRTTPSVRETLMAERLCRRASAPSTGKRLQ